MLHGFCVGCSKMVKDLHSHWGREMSKNKKCLQKRYRDIEGRKRIGPVLEFDGPPVSPLWHISGWYSSLIGNYSLRNGKRSYQRLQLPILNPPLTGAEAVAGKLKISANTARASWGNAGKAYTRRKMRRGIGVRCSLFGQNLKQVPLVLALLSRTRALYVIPPVYWSVDSLQLLC
jgi:hypothetical protein